LVIFQKNLSIPVLSEVTLESWRQFLVTVEPNDLGSHLSFTCATYIALWDVFSQRSRELVVESLQAAFNRFGAALLDYLDDIPDLSVIDDLKPLQLHLSQLRPPLSSEEAIDRVLDRCKNSNITIATLSLQELRRFMLSDDDGFTQSLADGDAFDPLIGRIVATLFNAACREGEEVEPLRLVAYECLGILGGVDPYRFELPSEPTVTIILKNFSDDSENIKFVLHLISDLLVDKFRSTQDLEHQTQISYPIQELLKFCGFTSDLFQSGRSVPVKVRNRWANLKEEVVTTVAPLIGGRYTLSAERQPKSTSPLYPSQTTYREWLQNWVAYLIHRVSQSEARKIFSVFAVVVTHGDAVIARHLLPHLVLHILICGNAEDAQRIRTEISTVLEDQINPNSTSPNDKKRLSAQVRASSSQPNMPD
jgi:serine/threonine-protein kinase ATR